MHEKKYRSECVRVSEWDERARRAGVAVEAARLGVNI